MLTINVSKDQRPNKRKLNPLRVDHVIYNLKLNATRRLKVVNGIAMPNTYTYNIDQPNPIPLEYVTQLEENVLVYEKNGEYYVTKNPWKKKDGKDHFNFIGCMVDIPQFPAYLHKYVILDLYIKTENFECVYGNGPKYKF